MNMNKYVIILFLLFSCEDVSHNKQDLHIMRYEEFKQIALDSRKLMCDSLNPLSTDQARNLVKIDNTINVYLLDTINDLFKNVHSQFVRCSFERVIKALDMRISVGMSYYSEKYHIFLGALKQDTASYFKLDSLSLLLAR